MEYINAVQYILVFQLFVHNSFRQCVIYFILYLYTISPIMCFYYNFQPQLRSPATLSSQLGSLNVIIMMIFSM